jgi:hypothetical protein
MLTALFAVHVAALLGVLVLARRDALLVDDEFRPMGRHWLELRVARRQVELPVTR